MAYQACIRIGGTLKLAIGLRVLANDQAATASTLRRRILIVLWLIEFLDLLFGGPLDRAD